MKYQQKTILLILIATLLRGIIAATIGLGNDEVYYRMYAQSLQWNYFDHPPMVGWLIRLTTANLWADHAFFVRLGAILSAAATTWLLFLCGKKIGDAYTGFLAAALYTATLYGSIIAGTFILPDSPQMICWAAGLYLLLDICQPGAITAQQKQQLLWFGVLQGIGMLCKIHTVFLWMGLIGYLLFYKPQWFKQPALYGAALLSIALFYPVIQWNIDHHFVTYRYHSERVAITGTAINWDDLVTFLAGQLFYFNPIIFVLMVMGTAKAFQQKLPILPSAQRLLLWSSLPLIMVATVVSLFKTVLPHWTGPAYSGLILLTASYFSIPKNSVAAPSPLLPKSIKAALLLILTISIAGILLINFAPGTLGKKEQPALGEGDFTLDMYGWKGIQKSLATIIAQDEQSGGMQKNAVIINNRWFTAAHLDYYVTMPLHRDLVAIADTSDIHQYVWLNQERKPLKAGDDAYCLVVSEYYFDARATYSALFKSIPTPIVIEQKRSGSPCRMVYVYRLKNYLGK